MPKTRQKILHPCRWVVKIGSALLTDNGYGLRHELLDLWVTQIVALRQRGMDIVIVSSGAVAEGISRLAWTSRPTDIPSLQAAAAVGQMGLIQAYASCFKKYNINTAQILLTHEDVIDRKRYLNAKSSIRKLLTLGVIPIINENDSVTTDEIRLGDNDMLAGLVTNLIEAELLVILTDKDGLFNCDPKDNPNARLIPEAIAGDKSLLAYASCAGQWGRGGMRTKLQAAQTAAQSGASTIIAAGKAPDVLLQIAAGEKIGTLLYPAEQTELSAKKRWLAGHTHVQGKLTIDDGAVKALLQQGKSLLAAGVTEVKGDFRRGAVVACLSSKAKEIARGMVNYDSTETRLIKGRSSGEFTDRLGYLMEEPELIHRDNLILTAESSD